MTKRRRRKCLNCTRLFRPDPRERALPAVQLGTGLPEGEHGESRLHRWQQLLNEQGQSRFVSAYNRP